MEGRFWADGATGRKTRSRDGVPSRSLVLLETGDDDRDDEVLSFRRNLEVAGWTVRSHRVSDGDVVRTVVEALPDLVLLTVDDIDASTMGLTEAMTAKAGTPVAWVVRDPLAEPWCSAPLVVLGASDGPEVLRTRLELILTPPHIPSHDASPLMHAMLDTIPLGIVVISPNHGIVSANKAMLDLLGYTEAELKTVGLKGITHPSDFGEQLGRVRDLLTGACSVLQFEKRYLAKNGSSVWGYVTMSLARMGAEATPLIFATVQDWEQHRKNDAQEQLCMQATVNQVEKLEGLGLLAGGFAHDFRNMLSSIQGYTDLARRRVGTDEVALEHLERVTQASRRASELCGNLLIYAGRGAVRKRPVDLSSLVTETVSMMRVAVDRETTLRLRADPGLPAVWADATQLRQLVMNLILNGSDALMGRSGVVTVSMSEGRLDAEQKRGCSFAELADELEGVLLSVADTGAGIEPAAIARIFEPFFTTKSGGCGLGLATVLGIVRGHGGSIRVHSVMGEGTTFQVLLPRVSPLAAGTESKGMERRQQG